MEENRSTSSSLGSDEVSAVSAERLLRITDAARFLGVGRTTFYKLIEEGDIHVVRIGRAVRVPVAELDAFVFRLQTGNA